MNFIKPCKHIHIYLTNIHNKLRARDNSILELFPFVILNGFCICIEYFDGLINLYYSFS